ncbi:D-alanyl-D-alanine carboxypeptidase/D-alanyl-D-alanine-endopeptidase [Candidatus Albibeggiatoa sp. nov. NOAA]|uniref:D-alanyl-D-alanine carboxypeptidase/D-alanyl-D-alanine endopeptidase n=1 Tax=Candidatus Albibeggiatoa sp. nov. NOAA TaxID=3162724 RepID=UPI0032F56A22|nr:D-alanyl-D-alanine carboxypeptidase/D-alanyl-D-alanine-endopeptidase [Thiotrichaceae bacterium]
MKWQRFILVFILNSLAFSAHAVGLLNQTVDKALKAQCLDHSQTAVSIVSIPKGEQVYSYNPSTPLLPASTLKVVTTAASLNYLGPEFRFHTKIYHTGQRTGSTINGDLVIKGGGDPKLSAENLWRIAEQLKDSGVDLVTGNLIYDISFFDSLDKAPAWEEVRSQRAYDAKLCALSLNFNTITVHALPTIPGQPLKVWLEPAPRYIQVINNTRTTSNSKNTISAKRGITEDGQTYIKVVGRLSHKASEKSIRLNVLNPPRYAVESFRSILAETGIHIAGQTVRTTIPRNAKLLYTHSSEPLSLILKELNTFSNNFIAEQIIKTMAAKEVGKPGSHADGLQLVATFLRDSGVQTRGLILADGSGLSRRNRFTAQAMTDLLTDIYPRFDIGPDFLASLRVMGANGVHSKRLANSPAKAKIRAKTGTLRKVSTLTGYVPSQTGDLYAYALFLNNNRCGYRGADKIEDKIVNAIYQYGGRSMYSANRSPSTNRMQ